jgi:hypothetical protein
MSRVRIPATVILAALSFALAACGAAGPSRTTLPKRWPGAVTASNYAEARRAYQGLADGDNARLGARAALAAFDDRDSAKAMAAKDYDAVVSQFSTITALHSPQDFAREDLAAELKPLSLYLWEKGASRGDESVVLAALRALRAIDPDNVAYAAAYEEVDRWGVTARSTIGSKIEAVSRGHRGLGRARGSHAGPGSARALGQALHRASGRPSSATCVRATARNFPGRTSSLPPP